MGASRIQRAAAIAMAAGIIAASRGDGGVQATAKRELRGGGAVELLGVSPGPSGPKTWWGPDGRPLDRAPYDGLGSSTYLGEKQKVRRFAVKVSVSGDRQDVSVTWNVSGSAGLGVSHPPRFEGRPPVPGIYGAVATMPSDAATCTVRIGVARDDWKVEATSNGQGLTGSGLPDGSAIFAKSRAIPGGTALVVAYQMGGKEVRVVAVDRDGKARTARSAGGVSTSSGSSPATPLSVLDLEFPIPPEEIREFQLQTRSYEYAEFKDVPLEPRKDAGGP
jgi:hypothetical protein